MTCYRRLLTKKPKGHNPTVGVTFCEQPKRARQLANTDLLRRLVSIVIILFNASSLCWSGQWAANPESTRGTATVSGRFTVSGALPKSKPLPVFKSRSFCGPSVANETLLVSRAGGLKNAVVIMRPAITVPFEVSLKPELDNQKCAFTPHVQVAFVGSELLLKNSDPILHTVHARLGAATLFNVGLPHWRQVVKRLDRAGVIRIECDVLHTWMSAAIIVSDSPFVAISDERGSFQIGGLIPGNYQMEVWHERLGVQRRNILLVENSVTMVDVVYSAEKLR